MSIECLKFSSHESGSLRGFANFRLAKMGVEIFGCGVFMKNGKRWVSLPNREYKDAETGETKYMGIIRFIEKAHLDAFCKAALKAVDDWCEKEATETQAADSGQGEEVPF